MENKKEELRKRYLKNKRIKSLKKLSFLALIVTYLAVDKTNNGIVTTKINNLIDTITLDNDEVSVLDSEETVATENEEIKTDVVEIPKETEVEDNIIDTQEEVMNLINSNNILSVYYATSDINLEIPEYLSDSGTDENVTLPSLECLEVYGESEGKYLVKTNEYIGFVLSDNLEELSDTFVVVDISNQELKLYSDNEVILTSPVVTGKPSTPSDLGIFEIYDISSNRYLVGPGYRSYVDIMMKYNGGEGLHDAEYHTHEDGFKHGWRDASEFTSETYLTDGSHGCVNMLHDDVMTVREHVDIGTKVLVKE